MGETRSIVDEVEGDGAVADPVPASPAPEPEPSPAGAVSPASAAGATPDVPSAVVLAGAPVSFGDFYTDQYSGLVRLAVLLSGSPDNAPDLVQDCFVRLHGRWSTVREPLPYIRRSVVHACASHHRRAAVARRNPPPSHRPRSSGPTSSRTRWPSCPPASGRPWCSGTTATCPTPTSPAAR